MKMRKLNLCLALAVIGAALMGTWMLTSVSPVVVAAEPAGDHWRNHDGHWSFWSDADKRWYYTDGTHWFFHDGKVWAPYRFDKHFGKENFVRGDYKIIEEKRKVVLPVHEVFHR
jgi:hypothetical protein